jgi:hypothetical protein
MADKYDVYKGRFNCHTCKTEVPSIRWYWTLKELTWLCPDGHLSKVNLTTKRSRDSYEREERK